MRLTGEISKSMNSRILILIALVMFSITSEAKKPEVNSMGYLVESATIIYKKEHTTSPTGPHQNVKTTILFNSQLQRTRFEAFLKHGKFNDFLVSDWIQATLDKNQKFLAAFDSKRLSIHWDQYPSGRTIIALKFQIKGKSDVELEDVDYYLLNEHAQDFIDYVKKNGELH